jgi:hypothetical protein
MGEASIRPLDTSAAVLPCIEKKPGINGAETKSRTEQIIPIPNDEEKPILAVNLLLAGSKAP